MTQPARVFCDCETLGLDPITDRIVCISILNYEPDKVDRIQTFIDLDEAVVLERFWKALPDEYFQLLTFNGSSFDIPFLIQRSIIKNVKIKRNFKSIDLRKYATGFEFSYNRFTKGTLNQFGIALGYEEKKENGSSILKLFIDHDYETIRKHCEYDIELTLALYKRLLYCGVLD